MTYQTPVKVKSSGNIWIDGLTDGYRWGTKPSRPAVGYTFISNTENRPGGTFGSNDERIHVARATVGESTRARDGADDGMRDGGDDGRGLDRAETTARDETRG